MAWPGHMLGRHDIGAQARAGETRPPTFPSVPRLSPIRTEALPYPYRGPPLSVPRPSPIRTEALPYPYRASSIRTGDARPQTELLPIRTSRPVKGRVLGLQIRPGAWVTDRSSSEAQPRTDRYGIRVATGREPEGRDPHPRCA
jgi:hypothetical protein